MGRKRAEAPSSAPQWDWYLTEWMETLRVSQADLMRAADWSKGSTSEICNGKTAYGRRLVNEAANALNIEPFELLLPPDRAMALRGFRASAAKIVETTPAEKADEPAKRDGTRG